MPDSTQFGLSQIGQVAVTARQLDRAAAFYTNQLGIRHIFTVPGKMAFFDCNGISLMLAVPEKPELDHPSSIIYFQVDAIEQACQVLLERGVRFEAKPHPVAKMEAYELWMAFFRDSEENLLALMSRVPKG